MKYLVARCSLLVAVISCFNMSMSAQSDYSCGTPDMTMAELQALRNELGPTPSGSGAITYDLPVWFYIILPESNTPPFSSSTIPSQFIQGLNGYFSDPVLGIQFHICGISFIVDDDFITINSSVVSALKQRARQINPQYSNLINVFVAPSTVYNTVGFNSRPIFPDPGAIYLGREGVDAINLTHEMGHYFSLIHTQAWGPTVLFPNNPEQAQYVNDVVELLVNGIPTTFTCENTGDGICDTPADPNEPATVTSNCTFSHCETLIGCTPYPNDPLGVPYNPDPSLLMSYFSECRNRFSDKQKEQMRDMLTQHINWAFLIDSNEPTCQSYTTSDFGVIRRNCIGVIPGDQTPVDPVYELNVPLVDGSNVACGAFIPQTNTAGAYSSILCVNPYLGNGALNLLPDVDFSAALNGVTTNDLVIISKHILGIEALVNPFQFLAADANNSASITTFDIVELRKLLLGIYTELPNNKHWRYVPELCLMDPVFADAFFDPNQPGINPFNATWTNPVDQTVRIYGEGQYNDVPNVVSWMDYVAINPNSAVAGDADTWSFWAVKVGDVNCSAQLEETLEPELDDEFEVPSPIPALNTNQIFTVQLKALDSEPVSSWQLGLEFSNETMELLEVLPGNSGESFSTDNFGLTETDEGKIRALNFSETGTGLNLNNKILFQLKFKAQEPISNITEQFQLKNSILSKKFYGVDGSELEDFDLAVSVLLNPMGQPGRDAYSSNADFQSTSTAHPLPFSSELNIDYYLNAAQSVEFRLYDQFGKLLKSSIETGNQGMNKMNLSGMHTLPSGFYWYTLNGTGFSSQGKALKN